MNIINFFNLVEEQPLVHIEHGIGRYGGTTILETNGNKVEYIILVYAGGDKLYVPITSLHMITYYSNNENNQIKITKLGSDVWLKTRQKVSKKIRDVAAELLDLYANRAIKKGFVFANNPNDYKLFCNEFNFDLTKDQENAINAVISDMNKPLVMDRLICGDVGFGKTEIAMRAAFLAVQNNKQVAVLVPTTLLAQQHFDNFIQRFKNWNISISMISRFRTNLYQKKILHETAEGKISILIGTHKLLQKNIKWFNLGLLIIDEEHNFGVIHKEHIKSISTTVDTITLTATPIPRTLNMALNKIRDLSIIATPPAQRLAVKTFICEYDSTVIRKAILREIMRNGQVYYLYNNINNIDIIAEELSELVPEASISVGHGQMRPSTLEKVISNFYKKKFNVLVCTTIIENGIDIANANTIIIDRADQFGLAQLHQLRGRVGRSNLQAYAYLFITSLTKLSKKAHKRLEAISTWDRLGSGFTISTQDLDIRGGGELLGKNQSGYIESIGSSLYMDMLSNAISLLKIGKEPSLEKLNSCLPVVELNIPVLLPDNYITNINTRLGFYRLIIKALNSHELNLIEKELIQKFGQLPEPTDNLFYVTKIRQLAQELGIKYIQGNDHGGVIEFGDVDVVDHSIIIEFFQKHDFIRLINSNKFKIIKKISSHKNRLNFFLNLMRELKQFITRSGI